MDPITVYVDGLPVIRGQYGVKNGRYSVKIQTIQHPAEFLKSPLESARLGPSMMRGAEQGELYEQFSDSAPNISDGASAQSLSPEDLAKPAVSDTINSLADTLVAKDETGSTDVNQKGDTNG
jgi:flagellar motor switch protein FliM